MRKRTQRTIGPPSPVPPMPGTEGEGCSIVFGHNAAAGKVLMQFSVSASRLLFSPEEAEDVARQLLYRAKAARGEAVA